MGGTVGQSQNILPPVLSLPPLPLLGIPPLSSLPRISCQIQLGVVWGSASAVSSPSWLVARRSTGRKAFVVALREYESVCLVSLLSHTRFKISLQLHRRSATE